MDNNNLAVGPEDERLSSTEIGKYTALSGYITGTDPDNLKAIPDKDALGQLIEQSQYKSKLAYKIFLAVWSNSSMLDRINQVENFGAIAHAVSPVDAFLTQGFFRAKLF